MRLDHVRIDRYGPLAGFDEPMDPGIQLLHGPNESGKTLLVEGLLGILTGRRPAGARVDGAAVGHVTVADGAEQRGVDGSDGTATVDGDRTLLDVYADRYGYAFTPAEFRNVFVIRDGDLGVDDGYYESVTDQITGLRSDDIRSLMGAVRDEGRLTRKRLNLSSAADHGDAAGQREAAVELKQDVERYLASAREAGLDAAERELFEARRRVRELEAEVETVEAAVERERVEDLRETVASLESNLDERASLPPAGAVDGLNRDLEALGERSADEDALARRLDLYRPLAALTLLLAVLSVAALLLVDLGRFGPLLPVVGVLAAAVAGVRWGRTNRRLAAIEGARAGLLADAREAGLDPGGVGELRSRVSDVEARREAADAAVERAVGELRGTLDVEPREPREVAEAAAALLDQRAADLPSDPSVEGPVGEEALQERRGELRSARERVEERADALGEHRERLDRFERRADELAFETFTGEPLDVAVTSLEALATVRDRLTEFVETIERDAEVARTAHELLEGMAATEGEKVESLFGPGSRASEVFGLVTDGRYDAVRFDAAADSLVVTGQDGPRHPRSLSQGTRDQLFFAVRIGLAEQLLGGQRGVLVLDDAFVASDPARLDRQVRVLDRLADAGWQVLYLTAKGDAIDRLGEHCPGPIELDPL